jgi:hypothetical protein
VLGDEDAGGLPAALARDHCAAWDLAASRAIEEGDVDMHVAPLDICAGVLPLAQLGLHVWFSHYAHVEADSTALVKLAQAVSFVKDKVLDPDAGLESFLPAWGAALGEEEEIPTTDVYFALLQALMRDKDVVGATSVYFTVEGVSLNWTAFASRLSVWAPSRPERSPRQRPSRCLAKPSCSQTGARLPVR